MIELYLHVLLSLYYTIYLFHIHFTYRMQFFSVIHISCKNLFNSTRHRCQFYYSEISIVSLVLFFVFISTVIESLYHSCIPRSQVPLRISGTMRKRDAISRGRRFESKRDATTRLSHVDRMISKWKRTNTRPAWMKLEADLWADECLFEIG